MTLIKISDELKCRVEVVTDFQRFKVNSCNLASSHEKENSGNVEDLKKFLNSIIDFYSD